MELTTPQYWDSLWQKNDTNNGANKGFAHFDKVAAYLPQTSGLDFFEIGCAPGGILGEFCAKLGYTAHGVDFAGDVELIKTFLRRQNVEVGEIFQGDFLTWPVQRQYDIVASFGFIEHFDDPAIVVDRHFEFVKPGGYVVITLPNFARGQKILHWLFDRENLRRHNTRCMNLPFLQKSAARNNSSLLYAGYTGGQYAFWSEEQKRSWLTVGLMWRTLALLEFIAERIPKGTNKWFSPYIVAVYRKQG